MGYDTPAMYRVVLWWHGIREEVMVRADDLVVGPNGNWTVRGEPVTLESYAVTDWRSA